MSRRPSASRPVAAALVCSLIAVCAALAPGASPVDVGEKIDTARTAIEKWVETRRVISSERRDWQLGREMLNERIEVVRQEIDSVRHRIEDAQASITETDRKKAELTAENDALRKSSTALREIVATLETRTLALLQRLPEPLRERVKPLSQQIPVDANDTKLSLSQRFMNIIGVLNDVDKFNQEITVASELRTLPDGSQVDVTAVYIGIGQGYYVGLNDTVAGIGAGGAGGWVWTPANDAAPQIAEAIAVLKNEQVASFVKLPIEVD